MKKIIAIAVLAALVLSLAACSPINDTPVAVLWADGSEAVSPNSLINAMDRALYIENIAYNYYGAEGDAAKQLAQAEEVLNQGCAALMVELVDAETAQQFVELARAKDVPIIFFGTADVNGEVLTSYEKCLHVATLKTRLEYFINQMLIDYLSEEKNVEILDRNGDGVITVLSDVPSAAVDEIEGITVEYATAETPIADLEMIITGSDSDAIAKLVQLQQEDFNTDKLNTNYIGLFTVGSDFDVKSFVLENAPEEEQARMEYLEKNKFLVDLTTVAEEDMADMIYTTANVVDSGRITGAVVEDIDGIAEAAAASCASWIKGEPVQYVVLLDYIVYTG